MTIYTIDKFMWPEILALQSEAYVELEPETEAILKSKWQSSRETCFVYCIENKVVAYILAHGWSGTTLPKLNQITVSTAQSKQLFIHDLVVSQTFGGYGIGRKIVMHTLAIARQKGFTRLNLVAVQSASGFWAKTGFREDLTMRPSPDYGSGAMAMYFDIHA